MKVAITCDPHYFTYLFVARPNLSFAKIKIGILDTASVNKLQADKKIILYHVF